MIILDWTMPEASGKDVLEVIRGEKSINKNSTVIMVTAEVSQKKVLEIIELKVSGYIVKPLKSLVLTEKIKHIFEKKTT